MGINMGSIPIIMNKKEFKTVYKSIRILTKKLEKYLKILKKENASLFGNHKLNVDVATFRQAWKTVQIGQFPIYSIIYIRVPKGKDIGDQYLALESFIADKFMHEFAQNEQYATIIDKLTSKFKTKNRFELKRSSKWKWFNIICRGTTVNGNYRIIVQVTDLIKSNSIIYISGGKE